jgi:hypothetical protein
VQALNHRVHHWQRVYFSFQRSGLPIHVITLNPEMFAEKKQPYFSVGNVRRFKLRLELHKEIVKTPFLMYDSTSQTGTSQGKPYPPDTEVFLYYTTPPGRPRIAGELRFRVISSDDPSFASGSDLLRTNGQLWSRPLHVLPKTYSVIYEKLREEGLIPDDLHVALAAFPKKLPSYSKSQYLFTLDDTFIIDFAKSVPILSVVTEKGLGTVAFRRLFFDTRISHRLKPPKPYKGK